MTSPIASIVIPAHNAGRYIAGTLDSLLAQSHTDFEVIVVDDGSTDDTASIVTRYLGDGRVRLLQQPASGAPGGPRNRGIRASKGEYVFLFDADDIADPDKLALTLRAFADAPDDTAIAITDFSMFDESTSVTSGTGYLAAFDRLSAVINSQRSGDTVSLAPEVAYDLLLDGNFIGTSTVAIRRQTLERSDLFDESLRCSEDYDLWMRLVQAGRLLIVTRVLHYYRNHQDGISKGAALGPFRIHVLEKQLRNRLTQRQSRRVRHRIAENYSGLAWELRQSGDYRGAIRSEAAAFRYRRSWPPVRGMLAACGLFIAATVPGVRSRPSTGSRSG